MTAILLRIVSHILFIYMSHYLLLKVVNWERILKGTADNKTAIQLFVLFLAIALGYLVSTFFLDILNLSRTLAFGLYQ